MITSNQNPKVKAAVKLQNRKNRDEEGRFLIEGYRELSRALKGEVSIEMVFICQELFLGENEDHLLDAISSCGGIIYPCTRSVFQKLSYRDRPDGLLAIAHKRELNLEQFEKMISDTPLLIIAEAIEKPGNLGSIMRSADGVRADGVIVCDRCTDIYNPNVVRASVGTLFTLPVIEAKSDDVLSWLRKKGIAIVATSPAATHTFTEERLTGSLAIAVGTEQLGLSKKWLDGADRIVSIPMRGVADSLNVATATTLLLYEALRQRGGNEAALSR